MTIALQAYLNAAGLSVRGSPQRQGAAADPLEGERRLFLGWAQIWAGKERPDFTLRRLTSDPHPPNIARTNVPIRNIDAWYAAFGITGGRNFAPERERVVIW